MAYRLSYSDYTSGSTPTTPAPSPTPPASGDEYRLRFSDYASNASGPPDPDRWVGPPGPQGPQGEKGDKGDTGAAGGGYTLPTSSTTVLGGVKIDGATIHIDGNGVISAAASGVTSFNTRTGAITLISADVTTALTFTPYNATNPAGYVTAGQAAAAAPVQSFNTRTGAVVLSSTDVTNALTFTPYNATNPSGFQTAANVTASLAPYALSTSVPAASSTTPIMDSAAAVGTGTTFARADHVHPTDTSRYAASNPSGYQTAAQVAATAGAYLPLTGGALIGSVSTTGNVTAAQNVAAAAAVWGVGGCFVGVSGSADFGIYKGAGYNIATYAAGFEWQYSTATGQITWFASGTSQWTMRPPAVAGDWLCFNQMGPVGGNGAYVNISDERAKTGIEPAPYGLAEILRLDPIRFTRIGPPGVDGIRMPELGFSAQQVRPVIPEAVPVAGIELHDGSGGPDDPRPSLAVAIDGIVAALVNAVKTLDARIAAMEARP